MATWVTAVACVCFCSCSSPLNSYFTLAMGHKPKPKSIWRWLESVSDEPGDQLSRDFPSNVRGEPVVSKTDGDTQQQQQQQQQQQHCGHPSSPSSFSSSSSSSQPPRQPDTRPAAAPVSKSRKGRALRPRRQSESDNLNTMPPKQARGRKSTTGGRGASRSAQSTTRKRRRTTASADEQDGEACTVPMLATEPATEPATELSTSTAVKVTTRGQLLHLSYAKPPIVNVPFGSQSTPKSITELFHALMSSKDSPMPPSFKTGLLNKYPKDPQPSEWVNLQGSSPQPTARETTIFDAVADAYDGATRAYEDLRDENNWSIKTRHMLSIAAQMGMREEDQGNSIIHVFDAQSSAIQPSSLMPQMDHSTLTKKVNFLLSYNDEHARVKDLVDTVHTKYHCLPLSPTEDVPEAYEPQLAAIEVKAPEGDYLSSNLQLVTWLAAGLERVRQLHIQAGTSLGEDRVAQPIMPLIGVTVLGHFWLLYIADKAPDGKVTMYGPINIGDTLSFRGTFQVFCALSHVVSWGSNVYWPWLEDKVLLPLAKAKEENEEPEQPAETGEEEMSE